VIMRKEERRELNLMFSEIEDDAALDVAERLSLCFAFNNVHAVEAVIFKHGKTKPLNSFWVKVVDWLEFFDEPVPTETGPEYDDEIPF